MKIPRPPIGVLIALACVLVILGVIGFTMRATPVESGGRLVFETDFSSPLNSDWVQGTPDPGWTTTPWKIVDGRLHAQKIHNAALWLQKPLPKKVRIEFKARAETQSGDVKVEVFGDGRTHQSGYILLFGGWNNTINAIARQDEHGEDRKEGSQCLPRSRGKRRLCVEPRVDYQWAIERTGDTVKWYLDGELFLTYPDKNPVMGEHFAFNNWEAHVSFDDLKIYDLTH